jgi:hypothetical protein
MRDDELERLAQEAETDAEGMFVRRTRSMEDFRYDEVQEKYWDTTTGLLLGPKSVDGAIPRDDWPTRPDGRNGQLRPFPPSQAINDVDTGLTVEGSTWWPGLPRFIQHRIVTDRGALEVEGACTYNTYIQPDHSRLRHNRNPDKWIEHVKFLFPDALEHEHFFDFAAHMVQKPHEKVNHGLVIAGNQGIGKDTALLPLRRGVGEWNTAEIEPDVINRQYNGYVKSVMLVINEVRPHDEDHKASNFYNQLKPLLAAPPEMTPMEVKYANTIYVRNLCHTILTTNEPLTMYVPAEDRRLFVMTSPLPDPKRLPIFSELYFKEMYEYMDDGGSDAVVRWLLNRNIFDFNPGDPPPMTHGKKAIIESANLIRRTLADEIFELFSEEIHGGKQPKVIFAKDFLDFINQGPFFDDAKAAAKAVQAKNFHFKMDERGYEPIKHPYNNEWRNGKFRSRMAFVDKAMPYEDRIRAVEDELALRPLAISAEKF